MAQLSILDDLDAAGAHPGSIRPPHVRYTETWRPGDAVPPGISPPAGDKRVPWRNWVHGPEYDGEVAREIWDAVWASIWLEHADAPFPFDGFVETKRLPDGAAWGCLEAILDGGLSFVTLREGHLAWEDAPGAGPIVYAADTHTWVRLPSKDMWDAEAQKWVPKGSAPKATSASPDVEATETDVPAVIAPETVTPETVPAEAPPVSGGPAAFLHAHNLASDLGWKALSGSLDRTTPGDVRNAVARHVAAGSLSAVNAASLLACIEDPQEDVAPEQEGDEPDAPPDPAEFLANIWRQQKLHRSEKGVKFCPLRALIDEGLATEVGRRVVLLPPASHALEMRHRARPGRIARVELTLRPGVDPASEIVRRVEDLVRIGVDPDAPLISILRFGGDTDEADLSPVTEARRDGEEAVDVPSVAGRPR